MELPKAIIEEELIEPEVELDDEDVNDLMYDCYELMSRVLERSNPKWLQADGLKLLDRLEQALSWHKLH